MNIESFTVGIVTVVVFGLVIAATIGILKVTALAHDLLTLKRRLEDDERELSRDIHMVERTLSNNIDHNKEEVWRVIDHNKEEAWRIIEDASREDRAYTDRRIDKLIDTYFDHKNTKKEILKD